MCTCLTEASTLLLGSTWEFPSRGLEWKKHHPSSYFTFLHPVWRKDQVVQSKQKCKQMNGGVVSGSLIPIREGFETGGGEQLWQEGEIFSFHTVSSREQRMLEQADGNTSNIWWLIFAKLSVAGRHFQHWALRLSGNLAEPSFITWRNVTVIEKREKKKKHEPRPLI